jgi:soluble P-type ATPase
MLKAARLGVVVAGREGCAVESLLAADVCIADIIDGLNLLLHTKRLEATLKI